jgi:DNA polymerase III subunit delta'
MSDDSPPEPDRIEGAPRPRETPQLYGQAPAEADFLTAYKSGRLHSGWLIAGPNGVGKATLAYRIATFLLAEQPDDGGGLFGAPPPPATLDISPDHPDARLVRAGSHPRLMVIRRAIDEKTNKLRTQITVDEVRRLRNFFNLSATDGGRRVVIVDPADEMNPSAANAILKVLEEPPARTTLLLVTHRPSGLLPTIRSRCRVLRCQALDADALAAALAPMDLAVPATEGMAVLAGGSVGNAIRLLQQDGLATYADLVRLFATLPRFDRTVALRLADSCTGKGAEPRFAHVLDLMDIFLARAAQAGITGEPAVQAVPGEARLLARLSPHDHAARNWATLQQDLGARARHGKAVNLDPASLILDMLFRIEETARHTTAAA